jgi:type 1 glutamine amidotransferase
MKLPLLSLAAAALCSHAFGQNTPIPPIHPPDDAWRAKVAGLAPAKPRVLPKSPRKVLMASLATGYCHEVIPHVKVVIDTLAKTGAFEVTHSDDPAMFEPDKLARFDAVILNNTCTRNPGRNWFIDVLAMDKSLGEVQRKEKAAALEKSLIDFVAQGRGVVAIHGAIVFLNESRDFSDMMGGSFVMHPKLEELTLNLVEPDHPLLKAFGGKPFTHLDEPYLFNKAYKDKNFRPLLEIDLKSLDPKAHQALKGDRRHVSWIKSHGKGRVFYCSPSHRPETYEHQSMLQYYLDGIQYALGDLECDDSPAGK